MTYTETQAAQWSGTTDPAALAELLRLSSDFYDLFRDFER